MVHFVKANKMALFPRLELSGHLCLLCQEQNKQTKSDAKAWFDFKAHSRTMVGIGNKIWKNFGAKVGEAKQAA